MELDLSRFAPKEEFDVEDGIEILSDANQSLDEIDKKLRIMRKLAYYAADPKCDPVKRIEMGMLFDKLKREINELAQVSTGGVQLLNGEHPGESLRVSKRLSPETMRQLAKRRLEAKRLKNGN